MKYLTSILLCLFIYLGCSNNAKNNIPTTNQYIVRAINNQEIQEGWDEKTNRQQLIEAIKNADQEGLLPEDYNYSKLVELEDNFLLSPTTKDKYHQLLTEAFIKYVSHLKNGKINPIQIYSDWDIKSKQIEPDSILSLAITKQKIDSTIQTYKPTHTIYKNLKKALTFINNMPQENFDTIKTSKPLIFGKTHKAIAQIKKRLRFWGDLKKSDTLANQNYNTNLKKALIKFQNRHGIPADGLIGKTTLASLNISKEHRKQQIIANLERCRWFPETLGTNFLSINIPDFNLQVVKNLDTLYTYKVVVGTSKRKTPILSSKINNIVFNPTWTVPPTIIKEDLIPQATKNRRYFRNSRIKIFDYKAKEIPAYSWKPEDATKYNYIQDPGYNNALGVVKINFPNKHSVYLHDTNHRDYFKYNYRALSSGCVRIEKPLPLVAFLLNNEKKYSLGKIDTIVQTKKTLVIKLEDDYKVHFQYLTAWQSKNELQFRADIYQLDQELYLRLTNQFSSNIVAPTRMINK